MQQHAVAGYSSYAVPAGAAAAPPAAGYKRGYAVAATGAGNGYQAAFDPSKRQHLDPQQQQQQQQQPQQQYQQQQQQQQFAAPQGQQGQQYAAPGPLSPAAVPRETIYRLILDTVDTALIIGRGGNTVRQIEQTTGALAVHPLPPPLPMAVCCCCRCFRSSRCRCLACQLESHLVAWLSRLNCRHHLALSLYLPT